MAKRDGATWLIDVNTDPPRTMSDYREYAEQVRLYGKALAEAGVSPINEIYAGPPFAADGGIQ